MADSFGVTLDSGATVTNLKDVAEANATALEEVREALISRLDDLSETVKGVTFYGAIDSVYLDKINDLTMSSFSGLEAQVNAITFNALPRQTLFDTTAQATKQRVWQTDTAPGAFDCLNEIEDKIIQLIATSSSATLHNLNAVLIPDATKNTLLRIQEDYDRTFADRYATLTSMYSSPDLTANLDWLEQRYTWKREDREKNIFQDLFEMAQQSYQWAVKAGIGIHNMHADFTNRYNNMLYNMTAANIAVYKAEVLANLETLKFNITKLNAQIDWETLKFEREASLLEKEVQQANQHMKEYFDSYISAVNTNMNMLDARVQGNLNVAKGYQAIFTAMGAKYTGIGTETIKAE